MTYSLIILCVLFGLLLLGIMLPLGIYFTARFSDSPISIIKLTQMKLQNRDVATIVGCYITLHKAALPVHLNELIALDRAGQNLKNITLGLITSNKNGVSMTLDQAKAADAQNINLVEALKRKGVIE